uniref:DNA topoisomerase I n=1 Tax=Caenorhabditis tropicalis TaxID=1561998 RepID=A0A1I7TU75_9PELO
MKSDSKESGTNDDAPGGGGEKDNLNRSKRSARREKDAPKDGDLPAALKPKFPSQRIMRKKKSDDKLVEKKEMKKEKEEEEKEEKKGKSDEKKKKEMKKDGSGEKKEKGKEKEKEKEVEKEKKKEKEGSDEKKEKAKKEKENEKKKEVEKEKEKEKEKDIKKEKEEKVKDKEVKKDVKEKDKEPMDKEKDIKKEEKVKDKDKEIKKEKEKEKENKEKEKELKKELPKEKEKEPVTEKDKNKKDQEKPKENEKEAAENEKEGKEEEEKEEERAEADESGPVGLPVVEYNSIRPTIIQEEPPKSVRRPSRDGQSARSDIRNPKKALKILSGKDGKKADKRKDDKNVSNEPLTSGDGKKNKKKETTKRMPVKSNAPKSFGGSTPDALSNPIAPPKKPDRSSRGPAEKSVDEKPKKGPAQAAQIPPIQKQPGVKKESNDGVSQKTNTSTKSLDPSKRKKNKGFFKKVYKKTMFWKRENDYYIDPSIENLCKSYVPPEYNEKNSKDFKPNPDDYFKHFAEVDCRERVKSNPSSTPKEIFINNRPFWLQSALDEHIPKVQIQLHRPLKQLYSKSPTEIYPKFTRTEPFLDPRTVYIMSLKEIDKSIGVEELKTGLVKEASREQKEKEFTREQRDKAKEKELKRVSANTFYGTMMFEVDKIAWEEKQKQSEGEAKKQKSARDKLVIKFPPEAPKDPKDPKVAEDPKSKVYIYKLYTYNRKDRQTPTVKITKNKENVEQKEFRCGSRKFTEVEYRVGERQRPRNEKPKTPAPPSSTSSSGASASSKSITNKTSSAEPKK